MAELGWAGFRPADGDRRALDHREPKLAQRLGEAGGAEGARAHVGAAPAGAGFHRRGHENAGLWPRHGVASFRQPAVS